MPLNFFSDPQPEELECRQQTARFVAEHIRPTIHQDDAHGLFRRELFDAVTRLRLHAYTQDPQYGGRGGSHHCYYAFLEELGRGSLALSVSVGVTNLVQGAIGAFGTPEQKERFLLPLAEGRFLGAFSLSEPQAGSDAAALRLSARTTDGGYRLHGNKIWCTNAGHADLYLVMARTAEHKTKGITSFLVPASTPGFRIGKQEKKLGLRASTLAELVFEDCFVPQAQRLGALGQGFQVALSQLDAGRIAIGVAGVAAATEGIELFWRYQSATSTPEFPFAEGLQEVFAEHYAQLLSVKTLVGCAAGRRDAGLDTTTVASCVKLLASDLAVKVCHDAVHFMGYEGYRMGTGAERFLRDAKALQIVEGTNQIQRLVLAREIDEMLKP